MGCCESCLGKNKEEPNPRTPLIGSQGNVVPVNCPDLVNQIFDYPESTPVASSTNTKHDELSVLTGIIEQYNANVIDITTLDSKIDAVEYMNRVQGYNRKVASLTSSTRFKVQPLFSSGNDPVSVLSSVPAKNEDIDLITELSGELRTALNSVKVTKHNDLVLSLAHR